MQEVIVIMIPVIAFPFCTTACSDSVEQMDLTSDYESTVAVKWTASTIPQNPSSFAPIVGNASPINLMRL